MPSATDSRDRPRPRAFALCTARAHALEHPLDVCNRRLWQNPVPKIENERTASKGLQHVINASFESLTPGQEHQGVEIALHRHAALHLLARKSSIDRPIEPDRVDRNLLHVARQHGSGTTWKPDDPRTRNRAAHIIDDLAGRIDAPGRELVGSQNTGPGIEDLYGISPCPQLTNQIGR